MSDWQPSYTCFTPETLVETFYTGKTTLLLLAGFLSCVLATTVGFSFLLKHKAFGASGASTTLKLGHSLPTSHPVHKSIEKMKSELETLSGGTMTIDIYSSSVLGSEEECIEQLQYGSLAMTKTSAGALEGFVPEMAVFGLPYLFRDEAHFWQVLRGDIGKSLLEKGQPKFVLGLCFYDAGSRNFYTKDRPIKTPEDLAKMKIRVMNSATAFRNDLDCQFVDRALHAAGGNLFVRGLQSRKNDDRQNDSLAAAVLCRDVAGADGGDLHSKLVVVAAGRDGPSQTY